jgi:hypothetical protein
LIFLLVVLGRFGPGRKIAVNARGGNEAKAILFRHEMIAE